MPIPEKRWQHIIPVAFIMYTIAFVDRTNISLALPSLSHDLHMNAAQAGSAAGIFFWGYLLLQIPGGYLAEHWSAKKFISILLVCWGVAAVVCGLVRTWEEFWVMRFVLGIAEGGVWPATLVLLAHWFPRGERARANAYWMLCLPTAVVLSSPVSGWILGRWGWRAMLISEGALPFLWLIIWLMFIEDHPHHAKWISGEERNFLKTTLETESAELNPGKPEPFLKVLLRPQVLLLVIIYFTQNSGNYGYLFWLPSALHREKHLSDLTVGLLFTIPFIVTGIGMVLLSRHSDKTRERKGHVAGAMAWGGVFMLASVFFSPHSFVLSFIAISVVGAGSFGALGPFWAIPSETLPRSVSGSAMGLINALGNLGGYFGPVIVGYLEKRTGNFAYGFAALGIGYLVGALLTSLFVRTSRKPSSTVVREVG
ncbi:MAG TPA: MFS transporter [Terriglobia bacterium]|nr:MFS transporter [Terriglobia bacterium]